METLKFTLTGQNAFLKNPMLMSIVILLTDIYIRLHCLECWGQ